MQEEPDWATAKRVLGQPKFIERLMAYDADNIPDAIIEALQRVVTDPRFTADQVCISNEPCCVAAGCHLVGMLCSSYPSPASTAFNSILEP